jgi:hypothetical protein
MGEKQWFLYVVDHHEGPFSLDEIKKLIKKEEARPTSYVWREGLDDWMMVSDVEEFGWGGGDGRGEPAIIMGSKKSSPVAEQESQDFSAPEPMVSAADMSGIKDSDAVFCLNSKKVYTGPHSIKTLIRRLNDQEISIKDSIWVEGWSHFVPIERIPEITKAVKASVLNPKLNVGKEKKKGAGLLGLSSGGVSIPRYRFWKGRIFITFLLILPVASYQLVAKGMIPGVSVSLPPIPVDGAIDATIGLISAAPKALAPVVDVMSDYIPEPLQQYFSSIPEIEGVDAEKLKEMRRISRKSLGDGVEVATALAVGDEINPIFHVAANLPDGTTLTLELIGKEGTLINALNYRKKSYVDIQNKYGKSLKFASEGTKPVPRGQYTLVIYESDKQTPDVMAVLSKLTPKKLASSLIPPGKVIAVIEPFFLGGKNDEIYKSRLQEFNSKLMERKKVELAELTQFISLMESNLVESENKLKAVVSIKQPAQKSALWGQHYQRIQTMNDQLGAVLNKREDELEKEKVLSSQYVNLSTLFIEYKDIITAANEVAAAQAPQAVSIQGIVEKSKGIAQKFAAAKNDLEKVYNTLAPKEGQDK